MWQRMKNDRAANYANTTHTNVGKANQNIKLREQTENHIKDLEEMEQRLLGVMQNTMQRKNAAL